MNGKKCKVLRKTAYLLFLNKEYMANYPDWFTEKILYKHLKGKDNDKTTGNKS